MAFSMFELDTESCFSNTPLISVIIPVYNVEPYLRRCLDSIIHNTYKNLEIICVNDGSTDHSLQILKEYAETDNRIRIIDKPNGGLPTARNAGIEIATGELVAHVDSDDWIHKQYFEVLVNTWEATDRKADVVMCGFINTDSWMEDTDIDTQAPNYLVGSWDLVNKFSPFSVYVWAKIYKRSLIGDFRQSPQVSFAEDIVYNLNVLGQKEDLVVAFIENCQLYYYYKREQSIVHSSDYFAKIPALKEMIVSAEKIPSIHGRILSWEVLFRRTLYLRYEVSSMKRPCPKDIFDCRKALQLAYNSLKEYKAHFPLKLFAYRLLAKYPFLCRVFYFSQKHILIIRELLANMKKR